MAGLLLPWLGFLFGTGVSVMCRRNLEEIIAIGIETGIQNTGISIGILKVSKDSISAPPTLPQNVLFAK